MMKLELQQTDNILTTINKIKAIDDENIELIIPSESVLFENILNLKLIQHQAEKMQKTVNLITEDEIGNILLDSLSGKEISYMLEDFELEPELAQEEPEKKIELPKPKLPNIKLPSFPKFKKGPVLIILILVVLAGSFIFYGMTAPEAKASITVGSQPFTRSITIKVRSDTSTNVEDMVLKGTKIYASIEESLEKETTGTKIIGEKAEGEVKIFNRTTSEIELEKGDKLTYKGKSTDLNYYLKDDVEIPASTPEDPLDPESKMIPGEATVDIEAEEIGDAHNIDEDKSLEISDYDTDELVARTEEDISGGKSEEIKIVTEEDRTSLSEELSSISLQKAEESIRNKLGLGQNLIEGSTQTRIVSENYSAEVDDEAETISLTQSVTGEALVYHENDLNNFIDEYFKNVIPENHYMPDKDKEVKVEILGESTNSTLNSTEADIQVTLRSIVIPDIKEEEVKESLRGKTNEEAKNIIEGLKNVEYYEFSISPVVPFFSKVPKDTNRIEVIIVKEDTGESL
jgi:hypothetical protein